MRQMTQANLEAAFAGESQAHMKYLAFADKAEKDGLPAVAKLFRAIAYAERVHATNHLKELKGIGKTAENLAGAIGGENYEVDEMYAAFIAVAEVQEEKGAKRSMFWAREAEKGHAEMYAKAKEAVEGGKDADVGDVHVCDICGYTHVGDAIDECPVCKAKRDRFSKF